MRSTGINRMGAGGNCLMGSFLLCILFTKYCQDDQIKKDVYNVRE